MSETTHARGAESQVHPITGEPPGIKDILERRAAGEMPDAEEERDGAPPAKADPDAETRAAQEVASLRTRVADAEARVDEERRARQLAEQQRNHAMQGAEDTGFTAITTALNAAVREKESLQAEMKIAGDAGDFARIGEISAQLGELGATIRDLSMGKTQAEQDRARRLETPPRSTEPPRIQAATEAERGILRNLGVPSRQQFLDSRTPATRDFLYQHLEFFTDPALHQRLMGAESLARGEGKAVDTPEYFDRIKEVALSQTTQQPRREAMERIQTPGAPPSREAPGPTGRRGSGDVYVGPEDKKVAEWMGVDPVEYVTERGRLQQEGSWPYRRR